MSLSVQMINKMNTIKAKDTSTEIVMKLIDGNGLAFDMTGEPAKVFIGMKAGKVFEKGNDPHTNYASLCDVPSIAKKSIGFAQN